MRYSYGIIVLALNCLLNLQENLCTQYDSLSNSSQESPDFGYYSGSSKDFQSQNHPAGGGNVFQSPQQNLKVIQKNQRSRQRELKHLDITKHQRNVFHQSTLTVVNNYHISPQRMSVYCVLHYRSLLLFQHKII